MGNRNAEAASRRSRSLVSSYPLSLAARLTCLLCLAQAASAAVDWAALAKDLDPNGAVLGSWLQNRDPCADPPFMVSFASLIFPYPT